MISNIFNIVKYIIWHMKGLCDEFLRFCCSCLIIKSPVAYNDVNQQHHQFMNNNEPIDQSRNRSLSQKQQGSNAIANKLSQFLDSEDMHQRKQNATSLFEQSQQQEIQRGNSIDSNKIQEYTDVIKQDHPYYHLFKNKLNELPTIFQIPPNACAAEPDTQYPLKLYCYQDGKLNSFKYFFTFPTDSHTYQSISNDFELQTSLDPNIESFKKTLETPQGDAKLIYLSYKKILIMSSRDFEYVRYTFKKGNQYWNICMSDPSRQQIKGKVRGDLQSVTRIIERQGKIEVSVASTTDMKMPIKLEMAKNRGFAEIRKYLDKVYHHIKQNENKNII